MFPQCLQNDDEIKCFVNVCIITFLKHFKKNRCFELSENIQSYVPIMFAKLYNIKKTGHLKKNSYESSENNVFVTCIFKTFKNCVFMTCVFKTFERSENV